MCPVTNSAFREKEVHRNVGVSWTSWGFVAIVEASAAEDAGIDAAATVTRISTLPLCSPTCGTRRRLAPDKTDELMAQLSGLEGIETARIRVWDELEDVAAG